MTGYTDSIRQWATDIRRAGVLANADGTGEVGLEAKEPGSRLAVRFTLKVELDIVTDVRYQVFGCGFSMAACAVAADISVGNTLDDVQAIDENRLDEALGGLPAERDYCATLAIEALRAAVRSARNGRQPMQASVQNEPEHRSRVTASDPLYATLIKTPKPAHVSAEDRHLFACLLSVAARSALQISAALGLQEIDIRMILQKFFPGFDAVAFEDHLVPATGEPPGQNREILSILRSHLPQDQPEVSRWLTHILAARAAQPGHLWVAMGLFARPELSAAICRHLPSLAAANSQNMRWKRYLFKQACDLNGGVMCKSPNCGVCSDYVFCFAED